MNKQSENASRHKSIVFPSLPHSFTPLLPPRSLPWPAFLLPFPRPPRLAQNQAMGERKPRVKFSLYLINSFLVRFTELVKFPLFSFSYHTDGPALQEELSFYIFVKRIYLSKGYIFPLDNMAPVAHFSGNRLDTASSPPTPLQVSGKPSSAKVSALNMDCFLTPATGAFRTLLKHRMNRPGGHSGLDIVLQNLVVMSHYSAAFL